MADLTVGADVNAAKVLGYQSLAVPDIEVKEKVIFAQRLAKPDEDGLDGYNRGYQSL